MPSLLGRTGRECPYIGMLLCWCKFHPTDNRIYWWLSPETSRSYQKHWLPAGPETGHPCYWINHSPVPGTWYLTLEKKCQTVGKEDPYPAIGNWWGSVTMDMKIHFDLIFHLSFLSYHLWWRYYIKFYFFILGVQFSKQRILVRKKWVSTCLE